MIDKIKKFGWLITAVICIALPFVYRQIDRRIPDPPSDPDIFPVSFVCIVIIICTALILNKMESQKSKDQDKKEKDEETTP